MHPASTAFSAAEQLVAAQGPTGAARAFLGRVWNAARNILTQKNSKGYASIQFWFHIEIQLGFYDGEVRSNLTLLKTAEAVFFLAADTFTLKQLI